MLSKILNPSNNNDIKNLLLINKELHHKSRKRLGYHVYLSYMFYAFQLSSTVEKERLLVQYKVWNEEQEDDTSISSSSSVRVPNCHDISRFAGLVWRAYDSSAKEEWGDRAGMLNSRPRNDGMFTDVPDGVMSWSIERCVKKSLTQEWLNLIQLLRNAFVMKRNRISSCMRVIKVGIERVIIGMQVMKNFTISPLLRITIFGSPLFSTLLTHELSYRSKKIAVVHVHSHQRLNDLMNFGGIEAGTHYSKGVQVRVCPKVSLTDNMGREAIGYVLKESATHLGVKVEGNDAGELVWVQRAAWDSVSSQYSYFDDHDHDPKGQKSDIFYISHFWPIRITMNLVTGHSYLISSQYTCSHINE